MKKKGETMSDGIAKSCAEGKEGKRNPRREVGGNAWW